MKNILYIDTSDSLVTLVRLTAMGQTAELKESSKIRRSQSVLVLVEKLLRASNLTIQDITQIEVFAGPGSFTGLRVGVSVANTLATLLEIPINGKINSPVVPIYA